MSVEYTVEQLDEMEQAMCDEGVLPAEAALVRLRLTRPAIDPSVPVMYNVDWREMYFLGSHKEFLLEGDDSKNLRVLIPAPLIPKWVHPLFRDIQNSRMPLERARNLLSDEIAHHTAHGEGDEG